jgi:LemA protein
MLVLIIVLAVVAILVIWLVVLYNGLVKLRNRIENAWAQIDVQLKRRYDLIPNLVETVKGYAAHERQTLEAVIQARNMAVNATGVQDQAQAENILSGALKSLFALSEAYPDLKANQNFLNLQEELTGTEGRIAYARQFYNDSVLRYNTKIQTFPAVVLAGMMNFSAREYFEAEPESRDTVEVSFDTPPAVAATPAPAPEPAPAATPAPPADPPTPPADPGTPPPA